MGREATLYLVELRCASRRTDGWSSGCAVHLHDAEIRRDERPPVIWACHCAGREIGYCHIEKLHNFESLPPSGFHRRCRFSGVAVRCGSPAGPGRWPSLMLDRLIA